MEKKITKFTKKQVIFNESLQKQIHKDWKYKNDQILNIEYVWYAKRNKREFNDG